MWRKIEDIIWSTNRNSDDYDEKYMKIKFNSDDDLSLRKTIEFYDFIIVVRSLLISDKLSTISTDSMEWLS